MSAFFFNNLQGIIAKYGLSYRSIAAKAGVSGSTLTRYVRMGPNAPITAKTMKAVAEAFGLPPELIDRQDLITNPHRAEDERARFEADVAQELLARDEAARRMNVVGLVDEYRVLEIHGAPLDDEVDEYIPPPVGFSPSELFYMIAFRTSDDGLAPEIPPGAFIYALTNVVPKQGDYVVAAPTEEETRQNPSLLGRPVLREYVISTGHEEHVLRTRKDTFGVVTKGGVYGIVKAWTILKHEADK